MIFSQFITFLEANKNSIITGVIGSIIAVLLQVVVTVVVNTLTFFFTRRMKLKRLFSFTSSESIIVISGSIDNKERPGLAFLAGPDATAALNINKSLQNTYIKTSVKHIYASSALDSSILSDNIVTIGGPVFNTCTRDLLRQVPLKISFGEEDELILDGKVIAKPDANTDYGLVVRFKNPRATSKRAIIVAGCGTHGVLAASLLFDNDRRFIQYRKLLNKYRGRVNSLLNKDFLVIVKCQVSGNDISTLNIELVRTVYD